MSENMQDWLRKNPLWTATGAVVIGVVLYNAFKNRQQVLAPPAIRGGATWRSTMFPV